MHTCMPLLILLNLYPYNPWISTSSLLAHHSCFVCSILLPRLPLIASISVFSWKRFHQIYGVDDSIPILLTLALEIE